MVVGLIRFGPEDDSQFRRNGHSNRAYPPLTNNACDFHAELVIAPRVPSFPFALGVRLARTQIGPPPAPLSHPTSNRWPRRRCCVPVAFVVGSFALLFRPNFSDGPLLPIQLCNNLVPSRRGIFTQALAELGVHFMQCSPPLALQRPVDSGRRGSKKEGLIELENHTEQGK